MTPDQLKQIRERCERATPGPWYNDNGRIAQRGTQTRLAGVVADTIDRRHPGAIADADFIAHARTDIPLLLGEIERLSEHTKLTVMTRTIDAAARPGTIRLHVGAAA